jgi:hypothetical protein
MLLKQYQYYIFLFLAVILLGGSVFYGIRTNYFLNDDLPAHVAVVKELDNYYHNYANPFLFEIGLPDFHLGPYHLIVYAVDKVFSPHLITYGLDRGIEAIISSYLIVGFLNVILFLFAYLSLLRKITLDKVFIILGFIFYILTPDLPLLRWAGNTSLHGISYQFYYPQFFGIALLIWVVSINESFLRSKKNFLLGMSVLLSLILFLSHLLTGLLSIFISLLQLLVFSSTTIREKAYIFVSFMVIPLIGGFWPFYPVAQTLSSTNAYLLYYAMGIAIALTTSLAQLLRSQIQFIKIKYSEAISKIEIEPIIIYSNVILTTYVIATQTSYFGFGAVNSWGSILLPLLPGLLYVFSKNILERPIFMILLIWSFACISIYIAGVMGLPLKVYWRFLFMSKLPLAMIVAYCWYDQIKNRYLLAQSLLPLVLILFFIGTYKQYMIMGTAPTALHFKRVPQEYYIASKLNNIRDSTILSDPYTSYMISGLTDNKVYSVDSNRVSDYDQHITNGRNELLYDFYANPDDGTLREILNGNEIDYIVLNKSISIDPKTRRIIRVPIPEENLTKMRNVIQRMNYVLLTEDDSLVVYRLK